MEIHLYMMRKNDNWGYRGHVRMVVGLTTTRAISA